MPSDKLRELLNQIVLDRGRIQVRLQETTDELLAGVEYLRKAMNLARDVERSYKPLPRMPDGS